MWLAIALGAEFVAALLLLPTWSTSLATRPYDSQRRYRRHRPRPCGDTFRHTVGMHRRRPAHTRPATTPAARPRPYATGHRRAWGAA